MKHGFATAYASAGQSGRGDDRCVVLPLGDRVLLALADGAGASSRGDDAADALLQLVVAAVGRGEQDFVALLADGDRALATAGGGGETTVVVALVDERGIIGASVGDSEAWVVGADSIVELHRAPGTQAARSAPVPPRRRPFRSGPLAGATLLVASDGLVKYASRSRIRELIAATADLDALPARLIECVRLRSGALHDDTTVVLARVPNRRSGVRAQIVTVFERAAIQVSGPTMAVANAPSAIEVTPNVHANWPSELCSANKLTPGTAPNTSGAPTAMGANPATVIPAPAFQRVPWPAQPPRHSMPATRSHRMLDDNADFGPPRSRLATRPTSRRCAILDAARSAFDAAAG